MDAQSCLSYGIGSNGVRGCVAASAGEHEIRATNARANTSANFSAS
jgi:hypothetical protein